MLHTIHSERPVNLIFEDDKIDSGNKQGLIRVIKRLENDITDGSWNKKSYAEMDIEMMPSMLARANEKYPNLNLYFLKNPRDIGILIDKVLQQGKKYFRCVTNMGEEGIHCAVLDGKIINNKISLILFDSSSEQYNASNLLGIRLMLALKRHSLPEYFFTMFAMNIQRSLSECGIFSLTLAKKIHRASQQIEQIHHDNISGKFKRQSGFISHREIDHYLPPDFFNYVQSINRLNEYIDVHSKSNDSHVKIKCAKVVERFFKNLVLVDNKKISVSLHKKRIAEYKHCLKHD